MTPTQTPQESCQGTKRTRSAHKDTLALNRAWTQVLSPRPGEGHAGATAANGGDHGDARTIQPAIQNPRLNWRGERRCHADCRADAEGNPGALPRAATVAKVEQADGVDGEAAEDVQDQRVTFTLCGLDQQCVPGFGGRGMAITAHTLPVDPERIQELRQHADGGLGRAHI